MGRCRMSSAAWSWMCPLCFVKVFSESARVAHNAEAHPEVRSWRGPGPKFRGAEPPKVGTWRRFNNQDRRGGAAR